MHSTKKEFTAKLEKVQKLSETSKLGRLLNNPFKYLNAILYRSLIYSMTKKEKEVSCQTFFNNKMKVLLPSSTDIYLTGGKTHDSEIRLARYMVNNISTGDCYIDIGAHYGYFSLLASNLVGNRGSVIAIEPTPTSFKVLSHNISYCENITAFACAISDNVDQSVFYEFPNKYSEYNSFNVEQYASEEWYRKNRPKEMNVQCSTLDKMAEEDDLVPTMIKIDVEGAEDKVIKGGEKLFEIRSPIVIMEFLNKARGNSAHVEADAFLVEKGYSPHFISTEGELETINSSEEHLNLKGLDSDNIVYIKSR